MLRNIWDNLGRGFDDLIDWAMGCDSMAVAVGRTLLLFTGLSSIVAAPFVYIGMKNNERLEKTIKKIDQKQSFVFTSVDDCVAQGFSKEQCEESLEAAKDFAGSLGTTLSYSNQDDCEDAHGDCEKKVTEIPHTLKVGNSYITTYTSSTSYHPDVVAWQVARDDIVDLAVPLYQTPDSTKAIRQDGKVLNLKP